MENLQKPKHLLKVSTSSTQPYSTKKLGCIAEQQAHQYLLNQGLTLVTHNYRCKFGEVDLIMREQETLLFIEVRSKRSTHFGHPVDTINHTKKQRIIKSATHYLVSHKLYDKTPCRFDLILILSNHRTPIDITWIKNAFTLSQ